MPLSWVEPDVFLVWNGVPIYHIYKDDDMQNGHVRAYWYSTNIGCSDANSDGENGTFDVRSLTAWTAPIVASIAISDGEEQACRAAIISAIETGEIEPWED